jgi:hypothetical protein
MNRFFAELPTALQRSPAVEALHLERVALLFPTGETRVAKLEICPLSDSSNVAVSARLEQVGEDPRDGLIQYLTREGVDRIHMDAQALAVGARLSLDLAIR